MDNLPKDILVFRGCGIQTQTPFVPKLILFPQAPQQGIKSQVQVFQPLADGTTFPECWIFYVVEYALVGNRFLCMGRYLFPSLISVDCLGALSSFSLLFLLLRRCLSSSSNFPSPHPFPPLTTTTLFSFPPQPILFPSIGKQAGMKHRQPHLF